MALNSGHDEHRLSFGGRELERIVLSYLFLRQNRKQCIKRQRGVWLGTGG